MRLWQATRPLRQELGSEQVLHPLRRQPPGLVGEERGQVKCVDALPFEELAASVVVDYGARMEPLEESEEEAT